MVLKNPKKLIKGAGGALSEGETTEETPCWKVWVGKACVFGGQGSWESGFVRGKWQEVKLVG